jgi:hypothetical protein
VQVPLLLPAGTAQTTGEFVPQAVRAKASAAMMSGFAEV